ncbi:ABC transporter substrate-binding protein [Aquabacterium sp.]|uniref:ABC transporter substrate-binding protein n=1 Tax=Aquabacterium sp. TaxID=1872578 RepID=UPI0037841607
MKRRAVWQGLAAGLAMAAAPMARSAAAGTARVVRFGQSASLTGSTARHGREIRVGLAAALAGANRQEGPRGLQFELLTLDDGGQASRCADNARQLVDQGAAALVGFTSGLGAEACLDLVARQQVALIGPASGSMGLRAQVPAGVAHVRAGFDQEYRRIAGYIQSYGFRRVAHVYLQDTSPANLGAMTDALARSGLQAVLSLPIARQATSTLPLVQQLLATPLDAIVFAAHAEPVLAIIEQMNRAQFRGMYFASSLAGQDLIEGLATARGSAVMSLVVPRPHALGLGVVNQCQLDLAAAGGGARLGPTTLEGYIAGRVAVEAARQAARAGAATRQGLFDAVARLEADLGGYRVSLTPRNPQGSQYVDLVVVDRFGRLAG